MLQNPLVLILLGSFLPNNLASWLIKWTYRSLKNGTPGIMKPIRPYRFYIKFQSDPQTQYDYHRNMVLFWIWNFIPMNVLVGFDIWAILSGQEKLALLMGAVLLAVNTNYSLYANFDTETGDAHAAYASLRADEIRSQQLPRPEANLTDEVVS